MFKQLKFSYVNNYPEALIPLKEQFVGTTDLQRNLISHFLMTFSMA